VLLVMFRGKSPRLRFARGGTILPDCPCPPVYSLAPPTQPCVASLPARTPLSRSGGGGHATPCAFSPLCQCVVVYATRARIFIRGVWGAKNVAFLPPRVSFHVETFVIPFIKRGYVNFMCLWITCG